MTKEELLQEISNKITSGEITHEEAISQIDLASTDKLVNLAETKKSSKFFSLTKVLYILGIVIVIIGLMVFADQIWSDIGSSERVAITFVLGLLMAVLGSVLLKKKPEDSIGSIFHFIGGILIITGIMVTITEFDLEINRWIYPFCFLGLFIFYFLLNLVHKNVILTLFAIVNSTAAIYMTAPAIIEQDYSILPYNNIFDIYIDMTTILALVYLYIGYIFSNTWNKKLTSFLYFFASSGFFSVMFIRLVFASGVLDSLYFVYIIGGFYLSVYLRSLGILIVSTVATIAYVIYITLTIFVGFGNWGSALVILGFVFIGLGYFSVQINKKYIAD